LRNEPNWLTPLDAIAICREVVAVTGEPYLLLNSALLTSALDRPINHWHYGEDDMVTLAVMLLLGIGQNHPFEQGNKRTAFLAAGVFLELNGYRFEVDDSDFLGALIREAIEKQREQADFIRILRTFIVPKD
jgi:death on curing protein